MNSIGWLAIVFGVALLAYWGDDLIHEFVNHEPIRISTVANAIGGVGCSLAWIAIGVALLAIGLKQ